MRGVGLGHRAFRNRRETHALPVVLIPAPGRDAVKVAHVVDVRKRQEVVPGKREWLLDASGHFEPPRGQCDVRLFPEVEHRPVLDLMLTDWKPRQAMTIPRPGPFGGLSAELHVDAHVECNLAPDVGSYSGGRIGA